MTKNMGSLDKTVRLIVGLILISFVFIGPQTPWGWIGLIFVGTSLTGWCPAYLPFKFSTLKKEK